MGVRNPESYLIHYIKIYHHIQSLRSRHYTGIHAIIQDPSNFREKVGCSMIKKSFYITLFLLCCLSQATAFSQTSQQWNRKGELLFKKAHYAEAIKCFDKALELNSRDADAVSNRKKASQALQDMKAGKDKEQTAADCEINAAAASHEKVRMDNTDIIIIAVIIVYIVLIIIIKVLQKPPEFTMVKSTRFHTQGCNVPKVCTCCMASADKPYVVSKSWSSKSYGTATKTTTSTTISSQFFICPECWKHRNDSEAAFVWIFLLTSLCTAIYMYFMINIIDKATKEATCRMLPQSLAHVARIIDARYEHIAYLLGIHGKGLDLLLYFVITTMIGIFIFMNIFGFIFRLKPLKPGHTSQGQHVFIDIGSFKFLNRQYASRFALLNGGSEIKTGKDGIMSEKISGRSVLESGTARFTMYGCLPFLSIFLIMVVYFICSLAVHKPATP